MAHHHHRPYPKVGEVFGLKLNGDAIGNQPLEIVRRTGCDPNSWKHDGPLAEGRVTRSFKLVPLEYCLFGEVRSRLASKGKIPAGQWCLAFKAEYSSPNGEVSIGVADSSWIGPDGFSYFPYISRGGDVKLHRAADGFGKLWLWLVEVEAQSQP